MKKLILSAVAVFAFGFVNAQEGGFGQGDIFVTGGVGFGSSKTGDAKSSSFNFSPKAGYFVNENIAVGLGLNIGSTTVDNGAEVKTNSFEGEVFGRYYFTPASQFSLFGQLGAQFGSNKMEVEGVPGDSTSKTFGVNAGVGVSYFLNSNWALEAGWAGLGYHSDDNGGEGADKTNTFGLNVDLSAINFGLVYKF